jgi:hypothetical protein
MLCDLVLLQRIPIRKFMGASIVVLALEHFRLAAPAKTRHIIEYMSY